MALVRWALRSEAHGRIKSEPHKRGAFKNNHLPFLVTVNVSRKVSRRRKSSCIELRGIYLPNAIRENATEYESSHLNTPLKRKKQSGVFRRPTPKAEIMNTSPHCSNQPQEIVTS